MPLSKIIYGSLLLLLVIMLPVLAGFVSSCQPAVETEAVAQAEGLCNLPIPITENETMNSSENETIVRQKHDIPPIDAAVPEQTAAATFSLG